MREHNFKFAIGDMIKSKDGLAILLVTGHQGESDVLLPCYKVYELEEGTEREWSYKYIEGHYRVTY